MTTTCQYCGHPTTRRQTAHDECSRLAARRDAQDTAARLCREIAARRGEELVPDDASHTLWRINGCGSCLYGRAEEDAATRTHLATKWLTFLFLPVLPLGRYRVLDTGTGYVFIGKTPRRALDWGIPVLVWGGIWLLLKLAG